MYINFTNKNMKNIEQIIKDVNDQTDALYEGMCDSEKQEVLDAINELRKILNYIENENN
jgi:DNA mismatch repair ATPase MutS